MTGETSWNRRRAAEQLAEDLPKESIYSREILQKDLTTLATSTPTTAMPMRTSHLIKETTKGSHRGHHFRHPQGKKVYIERIDIGGNVKTRDKVDPPELRVYEQELFSATNIKKSTQNLRRLEYL